MTLTREEIINQRPGRQLDRWIQEHIFNWVPWAEQRSDYLVVTFQKPGEREPYRGLQNWESQMERYSIIQFSEIDPMKHAVYGDKDWSTDISAAWEVVTHLKSKYWYFMLSDENDGWEASFYWDPHRPAFEAVSTGAPEAICKAALLAALKL
ncbi:BC1872 family protein [Paenibacillus sp. FSL R10-2771]|uniref:BC1872 family protein n=1 Tax=Paenibacillus sp. FSL R10-2771 TaxID=2954693 RepID=UPI0030F4BE10